MNAEVAWGGRWEHAECGASGDAVWDDEDTASSGHDCDRGGVVTWSAEWECHGCGAGGVDQFDDDTTKYADHECVGDEDDEVAA
ncbi:hypothetical protein QFZ82_007625 [Streptomyces sp. V4I23]|uniref:hypothetical protein n=1 Tax=Streptomyces sp. V4I23 TaxID=3042282 RepID=UPI00277E871A|nr:hypothetical protein [Streptomyces sp. V4I23]MDQ1013140.1 hypothetical protein [Streptomyces sp. V4I23]